jgi:hypothetical protein
MLGLLASVSTWLLTILILSAYVDVLFMFVVWRKADNWKTEKGAWQVRTFIVGILVLKSGLLVLVGKMGLASWCALDTCLFALCFGSFNLLLAGALIWWVSRNRARELAKPVYR